MSETISYTKGRKTVFSPKPGIGPKAVEAPVTESKGLTAERRAYILSAVAGVLVVVAGYFLYQSFVYVGTDNAMVQAHATLLSSQVSGVISRWDVEENEKVKSGQILLEIHPDDYVNALDQKEADAASLAAQAKSAFLTYQRTATLFQKGATTKDHLDTVQADYESLASRVKAAQSQAAEAKLNLSYTQILAPADGTVGRKSLDVGMLASPGQPLLGFVASDARWVTANLKETDMGEITVGEKVYVTVDAVPGRTFEGLVDSISPATGATFTLLPPDNATGNFTKVVQRVPVRVKLLDLNAQDIDRLQDGLSANVKIRVRG
jgi:membrane fusion protein, multidrug efflux system